MTKPVLVLQHIACEPPAAYEDELVTRGIALHRVEVDEGEPLPDWRAFSGIVAMGGPMGAYEDERLPWLTAEKALIAQAVRAGTPYWGVCLGAQLLASSLGARVYPGPRAEVGMLPVALTEQARRDSVFTEAPATFVALQWHTDTWELPNGAVRLAGSDAYEQQAFVFRRAYAVQFHLEIGVSLATEWGDVPAYAESLRALLGPAGLSQLTAAIGEHERRSVAIARSLFSRWLERVVGVPAVASTQSPR
jgi:GMP synthase (glutamine-hydrolysing)